MSSLPNCFVCHQHFSLKSPAPFLLPCLHSVCKTCVESATGGIISCSKCQTQVKLTETRLQKDVVTEKEVLHLAVRHHPELVLCTHEEDGNQAVCWCKECEDFLCENCQMMHGSFKGTRKHAVKDVGELQPENLDVDTYCSDHPKFILDIWDEQCRILICRKCKDRQHAEHKTVDFDETVKTARREVADFFKEVQAIATKQAAHLLTIGTDLRTSDETYHDLTENISHTFNTQKTLMDQREKELQIQLKLHHGNIRRELNEKKNTSEACQKTYQATSDYISKALQYSSRHDIMSLRYILQSKTGECISSAQAIVHESPPLPRFNTDGLEKIKAVLAGFGSIKLNNDPAVVKLTNECGSQTEDWVFKECEYLKQELVQLRRRHKKQIRTVTRIKEEEKRGLYRISTDVSGEALLLNCARVEFSRAKYNPEYVYINAEGELINRAESNLPNNAQKVFNYKGTRSINPLPNGEYPHYFEVNARLGIDKTLTGYAILFEIALARDGEEEQNVCLCKSPHSYSLIVVQHCPLHSLLCTMVWKHGERLLCLPEALENNPGTSVTLHYGVIYDSVRSCIAFLDLKHQKIIGKIYHVDSSVALWPMFGVYNHEEATVSLSLIFGSGIVMTERKKKMILECLTSTSV